MNDFKIFCRPLVMPVFVEGSLRLSLRCCCVRLLLVVFKTSSGHDYENLKFGKEKKDIFNFIQLHYCFWNQGTGNNIHQHRIKIWNQLIVMSFVQYIILRKDLQSILNWPLGAVIAQACHASSAILHLTKEDPGTKAYLDQLDSMNKVVLATSDLESLNNLAAKLSERNIVYKMWIEQPENIPTCIAMKPYPRDEVKGLLKNLRLLT